jgi:cell wall-associated NlpC family hydrolase
MYHLRDARPVDRDELQSGDLVFFRTRGRGTADHVGVYVGNGKFISHRAQVVIFRSPPKRGLLGSPLCRRSSRHDAENHSLILVCRYGGRPPHCASFPSTVRYCIFISLPGAIPTIAGGRHTKVTVKGPAESGLSVVSQALRNTLYRRLRLR